MQECKQIYRLLQVEPTPILRSACAKTDDLYANPRRHFYPVTPDYDLALSQADALRFVPLPQCVFSFLFFRRGVFFFF